ncbi:MAG: glycerol kinase GlpK [Polyangiaceae bacterium]
MRYVLAIDQGTTSTRAVLFDENARVVATDQREHEQLFPRPGWVEHDALQILARAESVVVGAMSSAGITNGQLAAFGITNQRETTVLWDRHSGKPVAPAVVWQDTRTKEACSDLVSRVGLNGLRDKTGLPISTYFSASKLRHLLDTVPGARSAAEHGDLLFGTIDSWLAWNLCGAHVTDVTNASRTQLMNLKTLEWDLDLLDLFQVPKAVLPRIVPSIGVIAPGKGLLEGVPLSALLGDQQAALFGQGCTEPGMVKCTYGTGGFLLLNSGSSPKTSSSGLLTTVAYQLENGETTYALEGSVSIAGAAVQWLRDGLGLLSSSDEVETLARSVQDNGGAYFVPAFNGLYAPYWREDARGVLCGLTRYVNRGHLARATLEATAYQTEDVLEAMRRDADLPISMLRVDGGMVRNRLLMQFQADISRLVVQAPEMIETTALGVALAAGMATGYFERSASPSTLYENLAVYRPELDDTERAKLLQRWHAAVERALGWEQG